MELIDRGNYILNEGKANSLKDERIEDVKKT
jgi:hypothetical protein